MLSIKSGSLRRAVGCPCIEEGMAFDMSDLVEAPVSSSAWRAFVYSDKAEEVEAAALPLGTVPSGI